MAYAGSQAQAGRGSTLSIGGVVVGEIKNTSFNAGKWQTADVTNFESGSDAEFIATIRANGTIALAGNRVSGDAGQQAIESSYNSGIKAQFTTQLPMTATQTKEGDSYSFTALVISRDFNVDVEKAIDYKVELKVSGPITFTPGE